MSAIVGERDALLQATAERFSTVADGKAILMAASTPVFRVNSGGAGAPASIAVTAKPVNVVGDIVFSVSAGTSLRIDGNVATVDFASMTTDTALVQARIREFGVDHIANYMVSKVFDGVAGDTGPAGLNTGQAFAYKRAAAAPVDTPGDVIFSFATAAITTPAGNDLANGWSKSIPTGTAPLYVRVAAASSRNATDNIAANEWSAAVQLAKDGTDGLNVAAVRIYQRGATNIAPPLPSAACTFTFATGALAGLNNGWSAQVPSTGGAYLFTSGAMAAARTATDDIAPGEWAAAARLAADGATGQRGTVTVTAPGYSTWSDASAVYELGRAGYGAPVNRDVVTLYDATHAATKYFENGAWLVLGTVLNGNLLVDGSVAAKAVSVDKLSAFVSDLGEVKAGDIYSCTMHGGAGYPTAGYAWPNGTGNGQGFHLSGQGLRFGDYNNGAGTQYFEISPDGRIFAPGFTIAGGRANFSGNVVTGAGTGFRIEMGPDDPVYAMWAGAGAKNDVNAIFYLKRSGAGYFGGALTAGALRTAVSSPEINPNAQLFNGPFGSNGGLITVICSFDWQRSLGSTRATYTAGDGTTRAVVSLYRGLAGAPADTLLASSTFTGPPAAIENTLIFDEMSTCKLSVSGSFTFTDDARSTADHTYRVTVAMVEQAVTIGPRPGADRPPANTVYQRLSNTTVE
ncbi:MULTISPECIES: hypothetical protein [unclassified Janthinobacterium]|uniref:hypothetical protein n=1 Tax=unclassified Janthinobacterium TaxID=2610881 RepID=UPI00088CB71F|nr:MULTISPECIES: hypothetical protein [unclassified Janthinobacterium]SDA37995.1 hypothetical protein SAMN03159349_00007 [Janthinobacterium sp. 551a]SFA76217.1 hypothetical protein SAMN03159300_1017 [Janthinobacterium sp. 344]